MQVQRRETGKKKKKKQKTYSKTLASSVLPKRLQVRVRCSIVGLPWVSTKQSSTGKHDEKVQGVCLWIVEPVVEDLGTGNLGPEYYFHGFQVHVVQQCIPEHQWPIGDASDGWQSKFVFELGQACIYRFSL